MSGALGAIGTGIRLINGASTIVGTLGQAAALLGLGGPAFLAALQPASFRGVPFAVLETRMKAGRRKVIHEYPLRDSLWIEDLGKRGRVYGFQGFVVGDDAGAQIEALARTAEVPGAGTLVHPAFGAITCELLEFEAGETWDAGRMWSFRAEFVEPIGRSLQLLPSGLPNTAGVVAGAASALGGAATAGFLGQIGAGVASGLAVVQQATAAVTPYVATAVALVSDARRIAGVVTGLSGSFGRYGSGRNGVGRGFGDALTTVRQVQGAVQGVLFAGAAARQAVATAGGVLSGLLR